jgi:outer membrane protein assembly factor BamE (lipoprotein component of BamABCDE complex)
MVKTRSKPARRATRWAGVLLVALALPGCVFSSITFGSELPGDDAVAAIVPGTTKFQDVLHLLGPPEEYAQPTPYLGLRAWDPQEQRVLEERDVFRRRSWLWIRERRTDDIFWIPLLFTWVDTEHQADRIVVTFDTKGVVTAVGMQDMEDLP